MPAADGAVGVPMELGVVVGVQVNEAGRDNLPRGVEDLGGVTAVEPPDLGNLAVLDADVGFVPWHPRPIDDRAALNNRIELCHMTLLYWIIGLTKHHCKVNEHLLTHNSKRSFTCQ